MGALLVWLIVGAIAGWIAGLVVEGAGFGLIGNIVVGILGSVVAGYLFPVLGIHIGAGTHWVYHSCRDRSDRSPLCLVIDPESLNGTQARIPLNAAASG